MFLKNRNISSKIKRSKVTDYAALRSVHEPANGGPVFPRTFLDLALLKSKNLANKFFLCLFLFLSKLALPGLMLKYEQSQYDRQIDREVIGKKIFTILGSEILFILSFVLC